MTPPARFNIARYSAVDIDSFSLIQRTSGGGIGGLAFAIALAKAGAAVDVDIYESTASFSEVGAGIGMWPRVWDDVKMLCIEDELQKHAGNLHGDDKGAPVMYRKSDQAKSVICGLSYSQLTTYHRAEFLHVLEMHLPPHYRTHFGKRLLSYTDNPSEPIVLHFKDGSSAQCDLLVDADGVKSAVRQTMFRDLVDSAKDDREISPWYQSDMVRVVYLSGPRAHGGTGGTVSWKPCPDGACLRKGRSAISYPINQGKVINCGTMVYHPEMRGTILDEPWVAQVSSEELLAPYIGWDTDFVALLKTMRNPSRWAVNTVENLPTFAYGRVAILGDAAHSMTPFQASGAGQAIEDGIILAALLAEPETQLVTLPSALRIYDTIRRPFAQHIQRLSFETAELVWMLSPRFAHVTAEESASGTGVSAEELQTLHDDLTEMQRWMGTTTLRGDRERAVRILKEELGLEFADCNDVEEPARL